ncbi:hypothetical protein A6E02_10165 [Aliivibrio fischeri]|nr:hypothetical protein A6E02_10165 [Aliivibrio fischeri]
MPYISLKECCLKIGSGSTPRGGSSVYLKEGETYFIRSQNIYNDKFDPNGLVFISEDAAEKLKNVALENDDILLNITGDSVARVNLVPDEYLPARVNQHVAIIRPNPDEFDARYLRYVLSSPLHQSHLLTLASAGATRNALTKGMIESYLVPKPLLSEQVKIANLLSAFDHKIALNRQINQTLEQMAQTLFKSWFVDFDPVIDNALDATANGQSIEIPESLAKRFEARKAVRESEGFEPLPADIRQLFPCEFEESELGFVPKGWEASELSELIDVKHGFAFKGEYFSDVVTSDVLLTPGNVSIGGGFKSGKFKYYSGPIEDNYIFSSGDMYVNMTDLSKASDTLGYPAIVPEMEGYRFHHNQRLGKIMLKNHNAAYREFIYQLLCTRDYRQTVLGSATGTTVKHTAPKKILSHRIIHSGLGNIESKFHDFVSSLMMKVAENNKNLNSLTKLRDTLLPKIISGELRLDSPQGEALQQALSAE